MAHALFSEKLPDSASHYYLVYCVLTESVDFEAIKLVAPDAVALRDHVRGCFEQAIAP